MSILDWLQNNGPILSLAATVVLVIVTGIYVYFTKRILDSSVRQSNLVYSPVIGIDIGPMGISRVFGPSCRQLSVGLGLTNVGNAPAIEVMVDAEVILEYSDIRGEKVIPARFKPYSIPFIRPGEVISDEASYSPNFGNTCVALLLDDFREAHRLNILRIKTDATRAPYNGPRLRVRLYYRNSVGQYFESLCETYLTIERIPKRTETATLGQIYIPRPRFHAGPLAKEKMDRDMVARDSKRDLCGW